jgi:large subunit ribosomal protein L25
MADIKLNAQKRELTGRKVKNLRKEGLIPANVFGKKTDSLAVSLKKDEFSQVFSDAGETSVIKLIVEGEKDERPILIQNIHRDPISGQSLHVDLHQIILTEKVSAPVPVELSGEAPAVEQKLGILIQTVSEIEVEALPMDLPEQFVVDVSKLENVGDEVTLKDISFDRAKITPMVEEGLVLARIEPLAEEEKKVEVPAEEAVEEGAEGGKEVPAKGEEEKEGKKKETEEKSAEGGGEKKKEEKQE